MSEDSPEPRRKNGVIANKGRSRVSLLSLALLNNEPFAIDTTLDVSEMPVVLKIRSIPDDEDQRTTYPFTDSVRDPTPPNLDSSSADLCIIAHVYSLNFRPLPIILYVKIESDVETYKYKGFKTSNEIDVIVLGVGGHRSE